MSTPQKITVYDVITKATEEGEWINDEFEAVVRNAVAGQGKKPSKADLCDPDNPNVKINASWFHGGDFVALSGARCLFGGQGMKSKIYKGVPDLNMGGKSTANVLVAAPAGYPRNNPPAAEGSPAARAAGPKLSPADVAPHFHRTMKKIALLWMHCDQYVIDIEKRRGVLLPEQRQGAITSLWMTAKDQGLLENVPALRVLDKTTGLPMPFVPPAKPAPDPEEQKRAEEERVAKAAEAERQRLAHEQQQNNLDEDVPF